MRLREYHAREGLTNFVCANAQSHFIATLAESGIGGVPKRERANATFIGIDAPVCRNLEKLLLSMKSIAVFFLKGKREP